MVESNVHPEKSKLCRIIEENLPGTSIVSYARKYFRDDLGMEYINQVIHSSEEQFTDDSLHWRKTWKV
jgi:hypothetical protein